MLSNESCCCGGLLSVFHSVYAFAEAYRSAGVAVALWPECRAELQVFRSLMVFMESVWLRNWNDLVVQTDSSPEGYANAWHERVEVGLYAGRRAPYARARGSTHMWTNRRTP